MNSWNCQQIDKVNGEAHNFLSKLKMKMHVELNVDILKRIVDQILLSNSVLNTVELSTKYCRTQY